MYNNLQILRKPGKIMDHKKIYAFRYLLPIFVLLTVNASADDMMSTYQLASVQDQQYQAAISVYEAENARLGKARAGLLPFLGANASSERRN
jgi:hypothetical protein